MISVLVTGIGGGGVGEQLIKALRLSERKYKIVGTDVTPISKGFKEVDAAYVVPLANDSNYINELLKICKQHDIKALFPGSEPELKIISLNKEKIEAAGCIVFINPENVLDICLDKNKTVDFLKDNNFNYPRSYTIRSIKEISVITIFPLVLKPSVGGGGSMNVMIAQSADELELFASYLLKIYPEFIAQEYVGTPDNEYTVGVLFDKDGVYINAIALRRSITGGLNCRMKVPNNTQNKNLGPSLIISSGISQGEFGNYENVLQQCIEIAKKLKATCSVNLQCRLVDGKVYLFEINPRFSGTTSLRAMVGYNEPDVLIQKHILNEPIETGFAYQYAKIVRGLKEEIFLAEKSE